MGDATNRQETIRSYKNAWASLDHQVRNVLADYGTAKAQGRLTLDLAEQYLAELARARARAALYADPTGKTARFMAKDFSSLVTTPAYHWRLDKAREQVIALLPPAQEGSS